VYERCTKLSVHPRHPYAGELVYTAFSGSHQDAISKGMDAVQQDGSGQWAVPYLPIDPEDVGRSYESIIRINSQSGKGGVAYILEKNYGYHLPKAMHPEIGRIVQALSDEKGVVLEADEILEVFKKTYFEVDEHISFIECTLSSNKGEAECTLKYRYNNQEITSQGCGNGPIDACKNALMQHYPNSFNIKSYSEHSCGDKSSAKAIAYIEIQTQETLSCFGVGADNDITQASIKAMFCAINRAFS
jgi:2-isopropylmalate synthase